MTTIATIQILTITNLILTAINLYLIRRTSKFSKAHVQTIENCKTIESSIKQIQQTLDDDGR